MKWKASFSGALRKIIDFYIRSKNLSEILILLFTVSGLWAFAGGSGNPTAPWQIA